MRRVLLLWCLSACGGRTVLDDAIPTEPVVDSGISQPRPVDADVPDKGHVGLSPGCAIVLDVRMCTPMCTQFDCCQSLYDANGAPAGVGICWIDRPTEEPCNTSCEACVHKTPTKDVCVPAYLCTGLTSLSGKNPCFKPK